MSVLRYLKALVPLVAGLSSAFAAYVESGSWDNTEWGILGAAASTAFGVFIVPNVGYRPPTV